MPFPVPPDNIQRILARPGRDWSLDERNDVVVWLNEPPQLGFLARIAAFKLGLSATAQDAEDAWQDYCVKVLLRTLIARFDPALSPFQAYLLLSLKQFCQRRGLALGQARDRERPLERPLGGDVVEINLVDPSERPDDTIQHAEEVREEARRHRQVRRCVDSLPEPYRTLIVRHYFGEESLVAIARSFHVMSCTVRVRVHRARRKLKRCMEMPEAKSRRPPEPRPADGAGPGQNGPSKRRTSQCLHGEQDSSGRRRARNEWAGRMTKKQPPPSGADRLLADLRGLPAEPVGPHLEDEEFVEYSMPDAVADDRIEAHLRSCEPCAERMEHLLEVSEAWQGTEGERRLEDLSRRVVAAVRFGQLAAAVRLQLGEMFAEAAAAAASDHPGAATGELHERHGATADRRLRWAIRQDEGALVVGIGSHDLSFEGVTLRVTLGGEERTCVLSRVEDQVFAEISFPWSVMEGGSTDLRFDIDLLVNGH